MDGVVLAVKYIDLPLLTADRRKRFKVLNGSTTSGTASIAISKVEVNDALIQSLSPISKIGFWFYTAAGYSFPALLNSASLLLYYGLRI